MQPEANSTISPEQAELIRPVSGGAKVFIRDVVAKQTGLGNMDGMTLAQFLAKTIQLSRKQLTSTRLKWIKEANADPELCQ